MIVHFGKIDSALKENHADIYDSLQQPVEDSDIQILRDTCFGAEDVPAEIEALYRWHNGQTGYGPINPNDNWTFMPIADAIDAWRFLNDPLEDILDPWSKSWFPLFENGAGDYVVFECSSEHYGAFTNYWHNDQARRVEYTNLAEWSAAVIEGARQT